MQNPPIIRFKRGNFEDLPGLALGEPGYTVDTTDLFIGTDGTKAGNKFVGSQRYWRRESSAQSGGINLFESTSSGSNFIGLRAPQNVPETIRYILPASPIDGYFLKTNEIGVLSWSNQINDPIFSGEIEIDGNLNLSGDVSVGGTSAVFNTEIFDTKARIFNVGLSSENPSDTTWDLGVLFNYYKSNERYRSGVFWDDSTGRIGIASNVQIITNEFGSNTSDPIIDTSSVNYAPIVIGSLWVNDCFDESEVISCSNSERTLENITIDGGVY
jgi:hypothetical protein